MEVAIKVLKRSTPAEKRALERQVRLLSRLAHPGVVAAQGFSATSKEILGEEKGPCYWMPFVEGREILAAAKGEDVEKVLRWFRECLGTLRYVHGQKIVHGDLSPKNILIDSEGKARLIDFSPLPGEATTDDIATLPYMAPERIDGKALPASDLFSIGMIFYEALAGRHPRAGCKTMQDFFHLEPRALSEAAPHVAQGHSLVCRLVDRMIRVPLEERPFDAGKILEILERGAEDDSVPDVVTFHPVFMIGAEEAFDVVEKGLNEIDLHPALFAVHGISGVGKSRFLREVGFEAAMRGIPVRCHPNLHRSTIEELGRLLSELRSPPRMTLVLLEWNDDHLTKETERFFSEILTSGLVTEIEFNNLSRVESDRFIGLFLDQRALAESGEEIIRHTAGNPAGILTTLQEIAAAGKIRGGNLLPGWRDLLRETSSPEQTLRGRLGEIPKNALGPAVRQVAEEFRTTGRTTEALELIDFAERQISDAAEHSRLLRLKANILNQKGRFEEGLEALDKWFALRAPDEPLPLKTAKYYLVTGINLQNLDRHEEAVNKFRRCLNVEMDLWNDEAVRPHLIRAQSLLGLSELRLGTVDQAIATLEKALDFAVDGGIHRAEICRNLAAARSRKGDWKSARELLEEAKGLYHREKHREGEFSTFLQEGNLALENDDPETAEAAYDHAEKVARDMGSEIKLASVWNNQGVLARMRGRLGRARELLNRSFEIFRFLGNPRDLDLNRRDLAIAEAAVGRFEHARGLMGHIADRALRVEAEERVREIQEAARPVLAGPSPSRDRLLTHWNRENTLRWLIHEGGPAEEIRVILAEMVRSLPPELQATFSERGDYLRWGEAMPTPPKEAPRTTATHTPLFATLARLNEALLREEDMDRLLERLMEMAMEIAGAESGFLVLKADDGSETGPLPGYRIRVARNVTEQEIQTDHYALSLSAVRRALKTAEPVLTGNALVDPLFREARSVHLRGLKSILALPVLGTEGILGVFYLDHRFQQGLFEGDLLEALKAFAGVAALALQKGAMIDALRRSNSELEQQVTVQSRQLSRTSLVLKKEYSEIVGRSPKMIEALSLVDRITDSKIPVWIFGESGTGKEAIARALHFNSSRAKKPFVTENCSALPESLLESELFGHKKGAFTHAVADKKGILQYADGGTVFLDEVADMSPAMQSKLLRFLQEGEVRPIGSHETVKVDVRVVSASNKDLPALVQEGKFREDLFYRLNGVSVKLPLLRDRMEDLPLLVEHFLKKIAEREKKAACRPDPGALRVFTSYSWPGNIRELQNTLETAALFAEKGLISPKSLQFKPALFERGEKPSTAVINRVSAEPLDPILEKTLLAVRDNCFHKGLAAKALGISRRALYARLQRFGVGTELPRLRELIELHLP